MSLASFGVRKPVVVNLVMVMVIGAGLIFGVGLRRQFFPEVTPRIITIMAPYPAASPAEIERDLAIKIEDRIAELDDIEEINSTITEGLAAIIVKFAEGKNINEALDDVKREIDALQDLPEDAERIIVDKLALNFPTINLTLYGDIDEHVMKDAVNRIRDDLLSLPGMGSIVVGGIRTDEISVEVEPAALLEHGVSIPVVADRIRQGMVELPSGTVRSATSNVAIRTLGAGDIAAEVRRIVVRADPGGRALRVEDLASVTNGFEDVDMRSRLNGQPGGSLTIFKTGDQDAVRIAEIVKAYRLGRIGEPLTLTLAERFRSAFRKPNDDAPPSVRVRAYQLGLERFHQNKLPGTLAVTTDLARFIVGRLDLLKRNALWGGMLVFLVLIVLLNWRTSFWVAIGLVVSLSGTLTVMHFLGITLNLLTMFGLIVVLGLLVDDAIVVAENIISRHEHGEPALEAAVRGTHEVGWPVVATVLTTIFAFLPLALIGGNMGDMLEAMPLVVACSLFVSLIEAMFILPTHIGHSLINSDRKHNRAGLLQRFEFRFDAARDHLFQRVLIPWYMRFLKRCIRHPYLTIAITISILIFSLSMPLSGRLGFTFFEDTDSETVDIQLKMPVGTPVEETDRILRQIEAAAKEQPEVVQVFATAGGAGALDGSEYTKQPNLGQIVLELMEVEHRPAPKRESSQIIESIREALGPVPGVKSLRMSPIAAGPEGVAITLSIVGENPALITPVVQSVRELLESYEGVYDIADDADAGQPELQLTLRDGASEMGFTVESVARQVRGALYGLEAHTFAGEREDVDVRVMFPRHVRRSLADIERMHVFTPDGRPVPLMEVVRITQAHSYASIRRFDRRRVVNVTAEVHKQLVSPEKVMKALTPKLHALDLANPEVQILERGRQKEFRDSFSTMPMGMAVAAGLIYIVLAWLFSSYVQPLVVMTAIPFAMVGMIWGHFIIGLLLKGHPQTLTFLSMIGFIALSGVVVNDSLIYMEFFNQKRRDGWTTGAAALLAGKARLRAILLTTITTVFGLMPLMLEPSFQAQFLKPMAITITFGLMSSTTIILIVLPSLLVMLDDLRRILRIAWTGQTDPED